ncbi:PH domain-containing protein [Streptomyces sp. G-G2]|uniref:PH domain-containing protein n=1 Tax=Streptomyces sp. G-G2 TaxID=3046201 RepID=UPI0024BA1A68|nr:PH domain-containing protein [Streptomyces sp. G-G2]MDJ0382935.1 PH domain-containing protein [Streptomyces sp. G-G2]
MTSPVPPAADEPVYDDRVYRSPMAMVTGVLLLALMAWLCGDALVRGSGSAPWIAGAVLLFGVPLVVAFTLRPAVFANDNRLRVRNPFRTLELPWASVDAVRAGYSAEVLAEGATYQLWSIPVSLRERKKVSRRAGRAGAEAAAVKDLARASADKAVHELTELAERGTARAGAQGGVKVRWSYEIIAPAAIGAVALIVLLATR